MHPLRPILHWTPHWQTPRCLWQQLQELGHAPREFQPRSDIECCRTRYAGCHCGTGLNSRQRMPVSVRMDLDRVANELTIEDFDSQGRLKVVKLNAKALNGGVEELFP